MMKQLVQFKRFFAAVLLLTVSTLSWANGTKINGIYYLLDSSTKTASVTYTGTTSSYNPSSTRYTGSITIPSTVTYNSTTYSVTSIGERAFYNCSGLTTVTIPNSVTSIGKFAFYGCSGLTSVTIPNSVTSIGDYAFYGCSGITSITIPNSVTSIGERAFTGCRGLTSVTIPNSVTSIGDYAFYGCSGITSITIPNSVTSIRYYAFSKCSGLTSVTIPNSVTSIGSSAFSGCSGLTSIVVDKDNTYYDSRDNCNAIIQTSSNTLISGCKNTVVPNSVKSIYSYAFYDCSGLTSISIPESVTSIGDYAFHGCSGITSITIPNSVTSIGSYAFRDCSSLTSIVVDKDNTYYDSRDNCNAIIHTSSNTLISGCKNTVIPNSVKSIYSYAFYDCSGLTSITIPNSVTSIGSEAFYGCSGLTSITIPNSLTSIDSYAFAYCSGLTSVTIPNSVKSIYSYAFAYCSSLKEVYCMAKQVPSTASNAFGNNIASATLYVPEKAVNAYKSTAPWSSFGTFVELYYDFMADGLYYSINADGTSVSVRYKNTSYNSYSGSIVIPATVTYNGKQYSVTSIDNSAFRDCSGLKSVTIPSSVTSIGDDAFYGCSGLTSISIPESVTSIGNNAFYGCSGLTSISIPESVTSIGNNAFYGCSGITSITIPSSVTSIGDNAFYGCSGITSITIPSSVTSIGEEAFRSCSGLTSVTINSNAIVSNTYRFSSNLKTIFGSQVKEYIIGDAITSIGNYAFVNCYSLTSITIPNSVTSIGKEAFEDCSGLKSITIPNSVTSIGSYAFSGCSGLTSVTIPESVTSIGNYAFSGCSGLTSIVVDKDNTYYDSRDNCNAIIQTSSNTLISGCKSTIIPNSVTSIGVGAFYKCSGPTSITIPGSVTSIGNKAFYNCSGLKSLTIPESVTSIGEEAFLGCSGLTSVTINSNRLVSKTYTSSSNLGKAFNVSADIILGNTVTSIGDYAFYSGSKLNSITLPNSVTSIGEEAFPSSCKIYIDKGTSTLIALWDNNISPYDKTTNTQLTAPSASMTNSASSIRLTGTTYSGGMEMTSQSYTVSGTTKTGNSASFTGLTPGTSYPVAYKATVRYGGNTLTYTRNYSMSTSELTLTTSQPKVISAGNAIVEATSNLDDEEENAGFEWRRTDWTADFSSNTGAAYLYEGTMEGYIRNLYTEKLWKVRPYYRDNNGTYYYGEWVGLDPTNTSYFEPTVHTYAKISVTGNKASVSGYVQRGSDNVSKQGFKYWADASGARGAGITIPTSAKTIEAEGRVMEVELTGLKPNTTYAYVAFVTTTEGETFYGKQLSFTTGDDPEASVTGDANGNGVVEIGDVTSVLTLMATPEATGYDTKAADANQNGVIEIGDVTTILTIMAGE